MSDPDLQASQALLEYAECIAATTDLYTVFTKAWLTVRKITGLEQAMATELAKNGQLCLISDDDSGGARRCDSVPDFISHSVSAMDLVLRGVEEFSEDNAEVLSLVRTMMGDNAVRSGISVVIPGSKRPWGIFLFCSRHNRRLSNEARNWVCTVVNMFGALFDKVMAQREQQLEIRYALQAKREWQSTIDALREIICLLDAGGRVIRANRAVEEWGLGKVADVRGRTVHEVMHPHCNDPSCRLLSSLAGVVEDLPSTAEWFLDDVVLGKNLRIVYKRNTPAPGYNDTADSVFAVAIIENITYRKNTRKALLSRIDELEREVVEAKSSVIQENSRLLLDMVSVFEGGKAVAMPGNAGRHFWSFVLDNDQTGIFVTRNGAIVYCNQRLAFLLDKSREELLGKAPLELMELREGKPVETAGPLYGHMPRSTSGIYRTKTREGATIWLQCEFMDIVVEDDDISVGYASDITGQRNMETNMRRSENNLHTLTRRLLYAQEAERRRIATELHDSIGQHLSAVKMNIETAMRMINNQGLKNEADFLNTSVTNIRSAIDEVRTIAMDLRPSILDDLGLLVTIEWFCRRYRETYRDTDVVFNKEIEESAIPEVLKVTIYRVVQEALNNISKHAGAGRIWIGLKRLDAGIKLTIRDNGDGFDAYQHRPESDSAGLGLKSMRERAEIFGGTFWLDSRPGEGTLIEISWPDQRYS